MIDSLVAELPAGLTRGQSVRVAIGACIGCGLEFNLDLLGDRDFRKLYTDDELYSSTGYAYGDDLYPKYTVDIIAALEQACPARGRVLEVGFLDTDLLRRLRGNGWDAEGIDLDATAVSSAQAAGFSARHVELSSAELDDERYDAIIAIAVLEHIDDPGAFICRIHDLLVPGGAMLLQLPNVASLDAWVSGWSRHGWDMYAEPGHLFHYRRCHLERLFDKHGFAPAFYRTATIRVRGKLPLIPGRQPRLERRVAALIHRSIALRTAYTASLRCLDSVGLGDTHVIIGRKSQPSRARVAGTA